MCVFASKVQNAVPGRATRSVDVNLARPFKAGIKLSKHLRVALASESCWADAELGAEGVIEIR